MIRLKTQVAKFRKCTKLLRISLKPRSIRFTIAIITLFRTHNLWMAIPSNSNLDLCLRPRKLKIRSVISKDLFLSTLWKEPIVWHMLLPKRSCKDLLRSKVQFVGSITKDYLIPQVITVSIEKIVSLLLYLALVI